MEIIYQHEPNSLACGQAVLGMICAQDAVTVCENIGHSKETTLKQMREYLEKHGFSMGEKTEISEKNHLPKICVLSLETPRCWHWSLYSNGVFYDPEHGISEDFPKANRKYYFEIKKLL